MRLLWLLLMCKLFDAHRPYKTPKSPTGYLCCICDAPCNRHGAPQHDY